MLQTTCTVMQLIHLSLRAGQGTRGTEEEVPDVAERGNKRGKEWDAHLIASAGDY